MALWDNCLTIGKNVFAGQLFDMRTNKFFNQTIIPKTEIKNKILPIKYHLIQRTTADDQLPALLNVSKQFLLRELCYPTSITKEFIEFLLPPAQKYVLLCCENITETKSISSIHPVAISSTHFLGKVNYGSIVLIRIVPFDEDVEIGSLYSSLQSGAKHKGMLESCCYIESFTNWETKRSHKSINEAMEYAEMQLKKKNCCRVRYSLTSMGSKFIWQHDDDATLSALQNIIRLETSKNSLQNMLQRFGVTLENEAAVIVPLPSSSLDEHAVNAYNNHQFFNFQKLEQNQHIAITFDLLINISRLKLTIIEYMQKRYASTYRPLNPNIIHILDSTSLTIVQLCAKIFKILDENFIEERNGITYFNLKTKTQEFAMIKSSANFLLIRGASNQQLVQTFHQMPRCDFIKNSFLLVYIADDPKTSFLQKEFKRFKDEKVILHIYPHLQYLGLAKPMDTSSLRPALSSTSSFDLFTAQCRCGNKESRKWICSICFEFFTTDSSKKPCCKCGKYDIEKLSLKCFHEWHGSEFLEEKVGGILQSFVSIFGCSSSGSQRYENIEMGQELYELNQNHLNNQITISPYTVEQNIYIKQKRETASITPVYTPLKNMSVSHNKSSNGTVVPSHSYNLRSSSICKEDDTRKQQNDDKIVKQRSLNNDKNRFLVDSMPKVTIRVDEKMAKKILPSSNATTKIVIREKSYFSISKKIKVEKPAITKKINIAVIGQSGVGKSTLLNAIANYLKFNTAQDALNSELEYIIPCQFKVFYDDFSERLVSFGMPDNNELYEDATVLSTTQECKEHSFEFNGYKINFIDTPGLSDTAGVEKDAKNLEKIQAFICSSLDSLHAICFVVKANEGRMDLGFSNSMNDLLSIFPKSALSKVIFFMTHSRGTLYGPGDSMTPLSTVSQNLLKNKGVTFPLTSENIFCVDNESFLYLCAKNQGIEYSGASFEDFESSWKKSKQATQKFFDKVKKMESIKVLHIGIITDLADVLHEQKQILSKQPTPGNWFSHFLTAKMLNSIEIGNISKKYLDFVDMDLIKREAKLKNVDLKNLTKNQALQGVRDFMDANKNALLPASENFVQKCKTVYYKV